jgi:HD superfamily phosphohydrolase YqeK
VTAGLLHDLCRTQDNATLLSMARGYGLAVNEAQTAHPNLLHGPVAAEKCRRELGIESPAVYEAIFWHTSGCPGLGRLGQALYVADFAEPTRPYPEAAQARELLRKEGFDEALYFVAHSKRAFLQARGINDPMAEGFYLWVQQASG